MQRLNLSFISLFLIVIGSALLFTLTIVRAAVELEYFTVAYVNSDIELVWETSAEFQTDFFYLERATSLAEIQNNIHLGPFDDDHAIVPCLADTTTPYPFIPPYGQGGVYEYYDCSPELTAGTTYYYVLIELDASSGNYVPLEYGCATMSSTTPCTIEDPATATPTNTATATQQPTNTPTAPPTNTPTAAPTQTPEPSPTTTPTSDTPGLRTPQPTATPDPATATPASQQDATATPTSTAVPPTNTPRAAASNTPTPERTPSSTRNALPTATSTVAAADAADEDVSDTPEMTSSDADDETTTVIPLDVPDASQPGSNDATTDSGRTNSAVAVAEASAGSTATDALAGDADASPLTAAGDPDAVPQPVGSNQAESEEDGSTNVLLLWLGFIGATLIFIGAVIGAIVVFRRR